MKRILLILLAFIFVTGVGCMSDRSKNGPPQNTNGYPDDTSQIDGSASPTSLGEIGDLDETEIREIVYSTLGKMLLDEMNLDELETLEETPEKSVSVGFTAKHGDIDRSYSIEALDGNALIDAAGIVDEVQSDGSDGPVFYYSPIALKIVLSNYTFVTDRIGEISVSGNIECVFQGRLEDPTGKLIGGGMCITGTFQNQDNLTLNYDGLSHKIKYDITYKVFGEPFDFFNYKFSGIFSIDGQGVNLEEALGDGFLTSSQK